MFGVDLDSLDLEALGVPSYNKGLKVYKTYTFGEPTNSLDQFKISCPVDGVLLEFDQSIFKPSAFQSLATDEPHQSNTFYPTNDYSKTDQPYRAVGINQIRYTGSHIELDLSAKLLRERYPEGFTVNNIEYAIHQFNTLPGIKLDANNLLDTATISGRTDLKKEHYRDNIDESLERIKLLDGLTSELQIGRPIRGRKDYKGTVYLTPTCIKPQFEFKAYNKQRQLLDTSKSGLYSWATHEGIYSSLESKFWGAIRSEIALKPSMFRKTVQSDKLIDIMQSPIDIMAESMKPITNKLIQLANQADQAVAPDKLPFKDYPDYVAVKAIYTASQGNKRLASKIINNKARLSGEDPKTATRRFKDKMTKYWPMIGANTENHNADIARYLHELACE